MTEKAAADMIGRVEELTALSAVMVGLLAGRGRSLLIEGEAGIGKTTLLAAALFRFNRQPIEILRAECDDLLQRFPLSVMTQLLGVDPLSPDPRRAQAAQALTQPTAAGGRKVQPVGSDPALAAVEHLLTLVDQLCAVSPLVLIVEDLHWADEKTLLLWDRLSRATVQLPLLLIGTCRPVPRRVELESLGLDSSGSTVMRMALGPLPDEVVASLAGRLAGGTPGPWLAERLRVTAGNPLYVRELLDALSRSGMLRVRDGVADAPEESADGTEMAQSLAIMITDRLSFLSAETRAVLRSAAILGLRFSVSELAAITDRAEESLAGTIEEALAAGVLEMLGSSLQFRHGLLRESMYESMPMAVRAALQRHAAQMLIALNAPMERIAELMLPALDTVDGWELDWLVENADALVYRAPEIVADLLENALRYLGDDDPRHARLEQQLGLAAVVLGRWTQAERITQGILTNTRDPDRYGEAGWLLCFTLLRRSQGETVVEQLASIADDWRVTPLWRARYDAMRSSALVWLWRFDEVREFASLALDAVARDPDPLTVVYALHARSIVSALEHDFASALNDVERALKAAGSEPELADMRLVLLGNRFTMLGNMNRLPQAMEAAREALAQAEPMGHVPRLDDLRVQAGMVAYKMGRWDDALTEFDLAAGVTPASTMDVYRLVHLALIAGYRDNGREASRHLDALTRQNLPSAVPNIVVLLARTLEAERAGSPRTGVELLTPCLVGESEKHSRLIVMPILVRLALAVDDRSTALAAAEAARLDAEQAVAAGDQAPEEKLAIAAWCRALLTEDPAVLASAVDHYRATARGPMLGFALEDTAVLQAVAGDPASARSTVSEALQLYAELGAVWAARRAIARLRPLGVQLGVRGPRRRPKTGWQALTETELKVAEFVAQGLSNPDIAGKLMLSRRTVETHVSKILAKVQVSSRSGIVLPKAS